MSLIDDAKRIVQNNPMRGEDKDRLLIDAQRLARALLAVLEPDEGMREVIAKAIQYVGGTAEEDIELLWPHAVPEAKAVLAAIRTRLEKMDGQ